MGWNWPQCWEHVTFYYKIIKTIKLKWDEIDLIGYKIMKTIRLQWDEIDPIDYKITKTIKLQWDEIDPSVESMLYLTIK